MVTNVGAAVLRELDFNQNQKGEQDSVKLVIAKIDNHENKEVGGRQNKGGDQRQSFSLSRFLAYSLGGVVCIGVPTAFV